MRMPISTMLCKLYQTQLVVATLQLVLCPFSLAKYEVACPHFCTCNNGDVGKITCTLTNEMNWKQTCATLKTIQADNLDLKFKFNTHANSTYFFPSLDCLPSLNSFDLSATALRDVPSGSFQAIQISSTLNLSLNNLTKLADNSLSGLETILNLLLSNNRISQVTNKIFSGLNSLQYLDLSNNELRLIDITSFNDLHSLRHLNLAFNKLVIFSSWHLPTSMSLKILNLQGNQIKHIDTDRENLTESAVHFLSNLDISNNPLDCSCTIGYLLKTLLHHVHSLDNPGKTICNTPKNLQNVSVLSLNETDMVCSKPLNIISYPAHQKYVVRTETIHLECRSDGNPSPTILWITPWGDKFSHPLQPHFSGRRFSDEGLFMFKQYEDEIVDMLTTVSVNEKNDLVISGMRGSLSGNFTCIAINIAGNKTETIDLTISSFLKDVFGQSLVLSGYMTSGILLLGFVIGFIKSFTITLKHKICFRVPIFSTVTSIKPMSLSYKDHDANFSEIENLSVSTAIECAENDAIASNSNYMDSPTGGSPEKKLPLHIIDSLEEAKGRLRDGVGRKMESVRRNIQSIRHSGSTYVQNIMESGSTAASRMKASVALGVETVKSHVQSVKELCGTGDMGTHTTCSMISVETDIDTNEQRNIVRQITYV